MTAEANNKKKRPWLAVVLSIVLPGLGQIYNGSFGKGAALLAIHFLITLLNRDLFRQFVEKQISGRDENIFAAYMLAGLILTGLAVVDAKMDAERAGSGIQREDE